VFPSSVEPPAFLIVTGPNGSGKSSAYEHANIEKGGRSVWIVNPDILAKRIAEVETLQDCSTFSEPLPFGLC
jgi:predicted ABC-type ATPase